MSDEHQIPWGRAGPTDPVERALAHNVDLDRIRLERPVSWSTEDIPEEQLNRGEDADGR